MSKSTGHKDSNLSIGEIVAKTESFVEKNQKVILIALAALLVIVLGCFGFYKFYMQPREVKASEEIFPAQEWYGMDSLNLALNGNSAHLGFIDVADQYSSTKAGNLAKYYAGMCYLHKGEYQNAIEYFQKYKGKDVITSQLALIGTGDAYLELGDNANAATEYKKASEFNKNEMITPYALFKAGVAFEMGNNVADALKMYNLIKSEYPFSPEYREIDKYIARIEALGKTK